MCVHFFYCHTRLLIYTRQRRKTPEPVEECQARGRSEASGAFSTGNRQCGQHQGPGRSPVRPGSLPLGEEEGCSFTARGAARNDILVDYGCIGSRNNLSAVIRMLDPQQSTRRGFQLPTSMLEAVLGVRGNLHYFSRPTPRVSHPRPGEWRSWTPGRWAPAPSRPGSRPDGPGISRFKAGHRGRSTADR